ncbi:U4/U6 small nuclear ribonucleoprotein Prp3 [Cucumis melo var. makuwa]|uniref:U4/U6 small nuclear ribonucleoprotein Prp3 n=1 Tax=Cucumis melo var. makuwa TaxID=1194695 RepID=A0A5A7U191_CUCMM|nr:U4/U6 small nuclear ribonucleoprotein Prp3 [Cucumis melo var. makuwa]
MLLVLNSPIHTTESQVKVPDVDSYEGADLLGLFICLEVSPSTFKPLSPTRRLGINLKSTIKGSMVEPTDIPSASVPQNLLHPSHSLPIKVSSISTTNENKGVSITRSHEVHGKSSTDGTSSTAGKSGNLSLDALAKAKKALQNQKELAEKLKKIPLLKMHVQTLSPVLTLAIASNSAIVLSAETGLEEGEGSMISIFKVSLLSFAF